MKTLGCNLPNDTALQCDRSSFKTSLFCYKVNCPSDSSSPILGLQSRMLQRLYFLIIFLVLLLFHLIPVCQGKETMPKEKISIALISVPLSGHIRPLKSLAEVLLSRGYRVSLALPEMYKNWIDDIQGLEFISLGSMPADSMHIARVKDAIRNVDIYQDVLQSLQHLASYQRPMYDALYPIFLNNPPDIVVVDRFTFSGYDLCHALHLPYVVNNPFLLNDIDDPPAYVPAPYSGFPMEGQSVWQRCANGFYRLQYRVANIVAFRDINKARESVSLPRLTSKWDLVGPHFVITNTAFGIEFARPMPPLFHMVGPLISPNPEPVDDHVEKWLQQTKTMNFVGIALLEFGDSVQIDQKEATILIDTLLKEKIGIIWVHPMKKTKSSHESQNNLKDESQKYLKDEFQKYLKDEFQNSRNVLFIESKNSFTIMQHESISFIVGSCDFHTVQESLYSSKPILGLPFTINQREVATRIEHIGTGIILDISTLNGKDVRHSALQLLGNQSYIEKASRIGGILQSSGGAFLAADLVVTALEIGTENLTPERNMLPWYKVYLLDVYAVYGGVLCGVTVILRTVWTAWWSMWDNMTKKNTKME